MHIGIVYVFESYSTLVSGDVCNEFSFRAMAKPTYVYLCIDIYINRVV